ncbi:MAG: acyclic terpene utilization AtuA family protein, partial [Candidatus Aminicenantales bacterium]
MIPQHTEKEFRVLSTTAILGYGFPETSFRAGIRRNPHLLAVDAGSTDPGPYYLGAGKSFTNRAGVKRDLRLMLREGVKRGIPVVIGSAGGSGARPHVDWCEDIIREIAREEKLRFKMGIVYADVDKRRIRAHLRKREIKPLACVPPLTAETLGESVNLVAQMGIEPIQRALEAGCQVVLAGRCYDPAVFAALPIRLGFDKALALHMGKILECAAIAATPGSGADCALGTLTKDSFILEALNPQRKFTKTSTAAHTLYEKSDPYHLPGPGGAIDLTH